MLNRELEINVQKASSDQLKTKPDPNNLGFGRFFTDHMFTMSWNRQQGWHNVAIRPYESFVLDPAAMVFHYGQAIFEGMKAYRAKDGQIFLFRPNDNFTRMNNSAERLCMPRFDAEMVLGALKELITLDKDWVPSDAGSSLYIRPTMIAIDPFIGLRPAEEILFYIITSPVQAYLSGVSAIWVEDEYVRAVRGGVGAIKTGGSYAASLYPSKLAADKGYQQVLWLDGVERKYIEEVGSMNIFFVYENCIVTPHLNGSILAGITRDSIIKVAKSWEMEVIEGKINIEDVVADIKAGAVVEIFGAGTAAVVSPIGRLGYKGEDYVIGDGKSMGALTKKFYDTITGIQYGKVQDDFGWIEKVM